MQKHVQMKCLWSKVSGIQCILSDLNIRLEQSEKENPAYKIGSRLQDMTICIQPFWQLDTNSWLSV